MLLRHSLAGVLLATGLAMSTATVAQPTTKLVDGLEGADIDLMWCSAVLFEESFWYDEGAPWGIYYDELSYELEMTAREAMNVAGFSQERQDAVWETYDAAAFELAEAEDGTFLGLVDECESAYGHLATPPKK